MGRRCSRRGPAVRSRREGGGKLDGWLAGVARGPELGVAVALLQEGGLRAHTIGDRIGYVQHV